MTLNNMNTLDACVATGAAGAERIFISMSLMKCGAAIVSFDGTERFLKVRRRAVVVSVRACDGIPTCL